VLADGALLDAGGADVAAAGDEVVLVLVVLALAALPVAASATPATPPPSPAATTPVMMSRRMRPDVRGSIKLLLRLPIPLSRDPAQDRCWPALCPPASASQPATSRVRSLSGI
jgi:hypothetical protein